MITSLSFQPLKTLTDMLRKVKLGKPVDMGEIPPEVFVPKPAADEQPPPQQQQQHQPVPAPRAPAVTQPTSPPAMDEQPDPVQSKGTG